MLCTRTINDDINYFFGDDDGLGIWLWKLFKLLFFLPFFCWTFSVVWSCFLQCSGRSGPGLHEFVVSVGSYRLDVVTRMTWRLKKNVKKSFVHWGAIVSFDLTRHCHSSFVTAALTSWLNGWIWSVNQCLWSCNITSDCSCCSLAGRTDSAFLLDLDVATTNISVIGEARENAVTLPFNVCSIFVPWKQALRSCRLLDINQALFECRWPDGKNSINKLSRNESTEGKGVSRHSVDDLPCVCIGSAEISKWLLDDSFE